MKTEPSTSSTTPPVLPKRGEPEIYDIIHPCLKSAPEERLHDFSVGLTMTHPTTFPHHPSTTSSVMPYLKICCQHQGAAARVTLLNCTQAVWGRFVVITLPDIRGKVTLAEVIVDSDGKCALLIQNGAELTSTLQPYLFGDQSVYYHYFYHYYLYHLCLLGEVKNLERHTAHTIVSCPNPKHDDGSRRICDKSLSKLMMTQCPDREEITKRCRNFQWNFHFRYCLAKQRHGVFGLSRQSGRHSGQSRLWRRGLQTGLANLWIKDTGR